MNEAVLQKAFIEKGCLPHQAQFAASFFRHEGARRHLLVSPPGMGKTFASVAIINHAFLKGLAHRVLVLAPSALCTHWQSMILQGSEVAPVIIIDRRRLRELEDAQPVGKEIWPAKAVVVMSLDLAKQDDVAAILVRCTWDLLVVDEIRLDSPQSQRVKILLQLMGRIPQMRVLLLQIEWSWIMDETYKSAELLHDMLVTVWTRETALDHQGKPLLPEVQMDWIAYCRRPAEVETLSRLQVALRSLDRNNAQVPLVAATLLQSASSSPFALEQHLRRIRQRSNELVHGAKLRVPVEIQADEVGVKEPVKGNAEDLTHALVEASRVTEPLLKMLEDLPGDAKFDALVALLNAAGINRLPHCRACVVTRLVDTALYLTSLLQEQCPKVGMVTASITLSDREQIVSEFAHSRGILVVTDSVELPMPEVAAVVFYDLPLNRAVFERWTSRFVRFGRRSPVRISAFVDESNALDIERLQRKIAGSRRMLGDQELGQVLFSKGGSV